ncbi:MAG: peptidyl-prolyl cis-trans isomerase [Acidobacteriales bacterium]|nr:peptidyl-prolyl cis-trans isomerase [Terriglobales bacterium]
MIRFLQTPGPTRKIVLSGLLLIICAAMVITLVPGGIGQSFGFGGPGRGVVAKVAGDDVTTPEVEREARQMLRQQFPKGAPGDTAMLLPFFTKQAADRLINEKALVAEAQRMGLHVTDEELRDDLQHGELGPMLFPGGNFIGQEGYEDFLSRNNLTVPQFEELEKNLILMRKVRSLVSGSAVVTNDDLQQDFQKTNTKVKFDYAVLKEEDLQKTLHPSDAELKAYYDAHKASYNNAIPEKRKFRFVVLDPAKAQVNVTDQDLQAYYDQHRDQYRVPEQVSVSHILIKAPLPGADGKVDPKGMDAAKAKAEDILKQIKAGANFADLAKKSSEDTESAKNGGSLGWIQRGRFPSPDVEKAAFSLPKGGTSDVINAGYGFDILRVDDKQDAHVKTLAEVKDQIAPLLKQQKAQSAMENEAGNLVSQARAQGFEKAVAAKGLQLTNTDYLSRGEPIPGMGPVPTVMEAVFNEQTKNQPEEAATPQGYLVYELLDIKPPATPTFEDIRARVENEFKNERGTSLLKQKTQELADRAKAEHDLKKAAAELGATVKTSDLVLPDAQVPELGAMSGAANVAFTMKPGEISGPIDSGNNGAVLQIVDKQSPSDKDFEAKKDQTREKLLQEKQNQMFGLFVDNLRDQMKKSGKIKVNDEEMKALSRSPGQEGE